MFSSAGVAPRVSRGTITEAETVTDLDGGARERRRDRGARDARDARAQIMRPLREDGPKHTIGAIRMRRERVALAAAHAVTAVQSAVPSYGRRHDCQRRHVTRSNT